MTIIDSNSGLRFSNSTYTVLKTSVAASINVFRTGYTDSVVSVNYIATNGTAVVGQNFVPTGGTLTFTNGVTNQSFNVTVINNLAVQPDVTVLLQLFNPAPPATTVLMPPNAAILTIHDNSGSFVIPAGSTLIAETNAGPANGIIDDRNRHAPVCLPRCRRHQRERPESHFARHQRHHLAVCESRKQPADTGLR